MELIDLLQDNRLPLPDVVEEIHRLTPFAAEFRYDDLPEEPEAGFDRQWALTCVQRTRSWAESLLGAGR